MGKIHHVLTVVQCQLRRDNPLIRQEILHKICPQGVGITQKSRLNGCWLVGENFWLTKSRITR